MKGRPEDSIKRLYFDSILHAPRALEFLVDTAGADHVLLGSDYPFDMGNFDCVAKVKAANLSDGVKDVVLGGRAREILAEADRRG